MKPCYEGFKVIRVDVNEIWRKMLCFRVIIGLLPLILIVSWNETLLWRFQSNQTWCQSDMKENVVFQSKYRFGSPYFDHLIKRNPVMKVWKKLKLMSIRYEGKYWILGASIGLLTIILIVSWNETLLWRFEGNRGWC